MHRWFLFADILVRDQPAVLVATLFVMLGLPPILLWIGLASLAGGGEGISLLAATLLVRHLALLGLQKRLFKRLSRFSPLVSLLAELFQPIHGIHAMIQRTIVWRTRTIRPSHAGEFSYVADCRR